MALGYSLTAAPSSGQHSLEGERFAEKGEAMTDARVLGEWLDRVRRGSLSRRDFARGVLAFGLTPPLISELLRSRGIVHAEPRPATFIPSRRGGGGDLKLLWWQAPTILNRHLAIGVKDGDGSPSSTSRSCHSIQRAIWCRSWPPKCRPCRTGGSPATGSPSPGGDPVKSVRLVLNLTVATLIGGLDFGWVEGQNLVIDSRWADAAEALTQVREEPTVILTAGLTRRERRNERPPYPLS